MVKKVIIICATLCLIIGLWPPTLSLYGFTGEEELLPQLRGAIHWAYTAIRPQPDLAPTAEIQYPAVSSRGVNTFLEQEALPEVRNQTLQMAKAAGFDYIRQPFTWSDIEIHAKGDFIDRRNVAEGVDAWEKYDNIVQLAQQNDIEIIARLDKPPAWSRSEPPEVTGDFAPPDDFNDFADFAAAVAERYKDNLTYYQIWNEPNGNEEWGKNRPVNAEEYTDLLCLTYERIKAIDPDAIILAGALTPTVAVNWQNLNDLVYLQRMYNAGAADCFDILSAQGYGLWSGATDHRLRPTVINYPHHLYLRDVMVQNGDEHKPIWISEMAWNVVPEGISPDYGRVTEEQQARYTVKAYERMQAEWPWVGVSNYWFFKRATEQEIGQSWYYFRLTEPDFTTLPVYDALVESHNNPTSIEAHSPLWYIWQQLRPYLTLIGLAILFFLTLQTLSKPPSNSNP